MLPLAAGAPLPRAPRVSDRDAIPDYAGEPELRVVLGPQADRFTDDGIAAFLGGAVRDAAAVRSHGRAACAGRASRTCAGTTSSPTAFALGGIQVPGDGQPIVLLVDRQSTGGYTKLATVCSFDIGGSGR